jgi:hypothetical protein
MITEEIVMEVPLDNFNDIFSVIETMFNKLNENNEFISGDNENVEYHIYYEIREEDEYEEEEKTSFTNCKEINSNLGKFEKIKDNDQLILNCECCNICCSTYNKGEYKRVIPSCQHVFHKKCVDKWLKTNGSCPLCRDILIK